VDTQTDSIIKQIQGKPGSHLPSGQTKRRI
jgi:hypothetical protein